MCESFRNFAISNSSRFSNTNDVCGSDFVGLSSHNHAVDELDYYLMDSLPDDCLECMKLVEGKL